MNLLQLIIQISIELLVTISGLAVLYYRIVLIHISPKLPRWICNILVVILQGNTFQINKTNINDKAKKFA